MPSDEKYLEMFQEEAEEHMGTLRNGFIDLENNPGDLTPVQEMYRAAHTLKGNAGGVGLNNIQEIMHKIENLMSAIRDEKIGVDIDLIDLALSALDRVDELVEISRTDESPSFDVDDLVEKLVQAEEEGSAPESSGQASLEVTFSDEEIDEISEFDTALRCEVFHSDESAMPAVRYTLFLESVSGKESIEYTKTFPDQNGIENDEFDDHIKVIVAGNDDTLADTMHDLAADDAEIVSIDASEIPTDADELEEEFGESDTGSSRAGGSANIKKASTLRVKSETLDDLLQTLSDFTVKRRSIESKLEDVFEERADVSGDFIELKRLIDQLRDSIMSTRLLPINRIFSRFPRLVRDVSSDLGKKVNLEIEGEDTELDKKIVDQIGDPLVHVLRNALDHGIEPPDERREKGKPEEGTIELRAFYEGNDVVIEVSDDGGGIPPDIIINKAIDKGMVTEEEADKMSDHEKIQYIMEPGFSTTEEVTDISGRGVGMDVVRSTIEKFRGEMNIESEVDKGSTFEIRFPLTMAIVPALLIKFSKHRYAIPLESVRRTETITRDQIVTHDEQTVIKFDEDTSVPAISLNELYGGRPVLDENTQQDVFPALILNRSEGSKIACICEEIIDQDDFVINPLGDFLSGLKGFSGLTLLGGSRASLIMDVREKLDEMEPVA